MNKEQFNNLKVGDRCVIKRGRDEGKKCTILYIKYDSLLIEPDEGIVFNAIQTNRKLRITSFKEIDPIVE